MKTYKLGDVKVDYCLERVGDYNIPLYTLSGIERNKVYWLNYGTILKDNSDNFQAIQRVFG